MGQPGNTAAPPPPKPRATPSATPKVLTAARQAPVQVTGGAPGDLKTRLKSEAENVGLNALSMVKEGWTDFRRSNRFFKYKVLIVSVWMVLSVAGMGVACPKTSAENDLGAQLYQPEGGSNVFMIKNEGEGTWQNVLILVNEQYRLAAPNISPHKDVTFNPKQLIGPDGKVAPAELEITDIELRTDSGRSKLLENGVAQ
jgi:hypothetical protein